MPWVTFVMLHHLCGASLYLGWSYCHAVVFLENIVAWYWLTIDSDQKIVSFSAGHFLIEELFDIHPITDMDIIGKTAAFVVNVKYSHLKFLSILLVNDFFA